MLPYEKTRPALGFCTRTWPGSLAKEWGPTATDRHALVYRRGTDWGWVCSAWELKRRFTKPGCPWTNGKAERFNRTLLNEWAYARPWTSNTLRKRVACAPVNGETFLPGVVATDLDTEHGGTDAN